MTKTHEIIAITDGYAVIDKESPCPKDTWAIFPNTRNGEIKDFEGCEPVLCKSDYAINGVYNLHIVASIGVKIEGVPLIEIPDDVDKVYPVRIIRNTLGDGSFADAHELQRKLWLEGYNANTKQYSEEDMIACNVAYNKYIQKLTNGVPNFSAWVKNEGKEFLKSLQKVPISVELEYTILSQWKQDENSHGRVNTEVLKVNPDNTITPKSINYES